MVMIKMARGLFPHISFTYFVFHLLFVCVGGGGRQSTNKIQELWCSSFKLQICVGVAKCYILTPFLVDLVFKLSIETCLF